MARFSQLHLLSHPIKQTRGQVGFEQGNAFADGRLGQV
jgi:hypothetical protein